MEAAAFRVTDGFNFKLFRFCDADTRTFGFPVEGSNSTVKESKAMRAAFSNLRDASNFPLADAVNFILATGCAFKMNEEWKLFNCVFYFNIIVLYKHKFKITIHYLTRWNVALKK